VKSEIFIQWKNTDVCFDFYCGCGEQSHYDGYYAYTVKCPYCLYVYEIPTSVKVSLTDDDPHAVMPEKREK
jgi:hypothetical protein